jgi:hypothetical protein
VEDDPYGDVGAKVTLLIQDRMGVAFDGSHFGLTHVGGWYDKLYFT